MLTWLLIALLIVTGWGGFLGWGAAHVEKVCLGNNTALMEAQREGPWQRCR